AGRHGDTLDAAGTACPRSIDRVFHEYDRIIVRERDARAAEPRGGDSQILGACAVSQRVHLARLRHVPVLTICDRQERREIREVGIADLEVIDRAFRWNSLYTPQRNEKLSAGLTPTGAFRIV